MKTQTHAPLLTAALVVLLIAACHGSPSGPVPHEAVSHHQGHALTASVPAASSATAHRDLATIREASARFQRIEEAIEAGFEPVGSCVASPAGGMGIHYIHWGRYGNGVVDPALPEMLLYEPQQNGRMRLVGVEFAINADAWGQPDAPVIAGQAFDPPNPAHPSPLVQTSYTLHVWSWLENPNGMFAHFNPRVSCPAP
jgi:hypothetical protein